jgi:hypothetical protein
MSLPLTTFESLYRDLSRHSLLNGTNVQVMVNGRTFWIDHVRLIQTTVYPPNDGEPQDLPRTLVLVADTSHVQSTDNLDI